MKNNTFFPLNNFFTSIFFTLLITLLTINQNSAATTTTVNSLPDKAKDKELIELVNRDRNIKADDITKLLDEGANINLIVDNDRRQTLLMKVIENHYGSLSNDFEYPEHIKIERLLIDRGANLRDQDSNGKTPLHYAITKRSIAIEYILEKEGVDRNPSKNLLDIQDNDGNTPLLSYKPISYQFGMPFYYLEGEKAGALQIEKIIQDASDFKIKNGKNAFDVNILNKDGKTLLMNISMFRFKNSVENLIKMGTKLNLQDKDGNTAASISARDTEVAELLIKYGADFSITNKKGETALSILDDKKATILYELIKKYQGEEKADEAISAKQFFRILRDSKNQLFMALNNNDKEVACQALSKQANAMLAWKNKLGEKIVANPNMACNCVKNECSISLNDVAPNIVKEMEGKCSTCSGPNCFNCALKSNGNLKSLIHTSLIELQSIIDDPNICKETTSIADGKINAKPGEIVVFYSHPCYRSDMYNPNNNPMHAFTFISDELSFSKDGFDKSVGFAITTNDLVCKKYEINLKILRPNGNEETCGRDGNNLKSVRVFDCKTNYIEEYKGTLAKIAAEINIIEQEISYNIFTQTDDIINSTNMAEKWSKDLKTLSASLAYILKDNDDEHKGGDGYKLQAKIKSLEDQIAIIQHKYGIGF